MWRLHHKLIFAGLLLITPANLMSQRLAKVKNIDLGVEQNKAIIQYDLKSSDKSSMHSVQLKFLDKEFNLVTPVSLSGDFGSHVYCGTEKAIKWDILSDQELMGADITPVIFVDGVSKEFNRAGGPGYAALSLLIPGLGDYFVADHRMMKFKPYLRTLSSLGLIGLGIYADQQRYLTDGQYISVLRADSWRYTGFDRYVDVWEEGEYQYWLFKGDKELFITMGAVVWISDIIWVMVRGSNNKKFLKELNKGSEFSLGYQNGGMGFKYNLTF